MSNVYLIIETSGSQDEGDYEREVLYGYVNREEAHREADRLNDTRISNYIVQRVEIRE